MRFLKKLYHYLRWLTTEAKPLPPFPLTEDEWEFMGDDWWGEVPADNTKEVEEKKKP